MRYTIFGFRQDKSTELGLDMNDLLLLDYIQRANGSPKMFHIVEDGTSYVWLSHKKIQEDLPILNITEGTLRNKLSELKKKDLIISVTKTNINSRGSSTYYSISDLAISLQTDDEITTMSLQNDTNERPRHSKMTSDNKLISNNKLKDTILSKDNIVESQPIIDIKPKKKSLYMQATDFVDETFDDLVLRENLKDWIKFMFNIYREQGKTLYLNVIKSKISRLLTFKPEDRINIVITALDNGWQNFYEPKDKKQFYRGKEVFGEDDFINCKKASKEELSGQAF